MRIYSALLAFSFCLWAQPLWALPLGTQEVKDRALARAILLGDETAIETSLAAQRDLNRPLYLSSHLRLRPLSLAVCAPARERTLAVLEYLLLQGAGANYQEPDAQDQTPLHRALTCGATSLRAELVALLLRHGAAGNLPISDRNGQTPVALAEHLDPVLGRQLKDYKPPEMQPFQLPPAPTAYHKGAQQLDLYQQSEQLLEAVVSGDTASVDALLSAGANPQTQDLLSGDTLLILALRQGHLAVAERLLITQPDLRATNQQQEQAIHIAAAQGQTVWLERLRSGGASIFARDARGWTPLHWAALRGQAASVKWLLARNANPRATGHVGETPADLARDAHQAAQYGFVNAKERAAVLRLLQEELQAP
jgi:ankyrin repeat protein